jgi:hypothetical protein
MQSSRVQTKSLNLLKDVSAPCCSSAKNCAVFKTPVVAVEVTAKIFVIMPRIDLYFELFSDWERILNIRHFLLRSTSRSQISTFNSSSGTEDLNISENV